MVGVSMRSFHVYTHAIFFLTCTHFTKRFLFAYTTLFRKLPAESQFHILCFHACFPQSLWTRHWLLVTWKRFFAHSIWTWSAGTFECFCIETWMNLALPMKIWLKVQCSPTVLLTLDSIRIISIASWRKAFPKWSNGR